MAGEFDFIDCLKIQQRAMPLVQTGIGDDLAVLKWDGDDLLVVGADQVLDGVHFDSAKHSPEQIGRKVMNRNLSDCAAMGALPAAAVVTVALPRGVTLEYAKELYRGVSEAAGVFDCAVVGGDTGSWAGKLVMSVTILGRSAGVKPVLRSGAKVGDEIYVTGALGGSILGRHLNLFPRVEMGRRIAPSATAMIDLSDGISRDLGHICAASGVGAIVEADRIPIHEDAIALSKMDGVSALEHARHDGEDYELLFTAAEQVGDSILIGRVVEGQGVQIRRAGGAMEPLAARGWEHRL